MSYFNLHTHTHYSNTRLLDAINKEDTIIDYAHQMNLGGIAITEHENLCSHVKAQKHLAKRKDENPDDPTWQNFKLILGNEIYLCRNDLSESSFIKDEDFFYHFILLALDEVGHKQLRELSTRAFQHSWYRNMRRVPTYYKDIEEIIGSNPGHVWGSTACLSGFAPKMILSKDYFDFESESREKLIRFLDWCRTTFNYHFSLEIQPSYNKEQLIVNKELTKLSSQYNLPIIITTDAHYLEEKDRAIHKAFLNSKQGERETDSFYATTYIMNEKEIHKYMDSYIGEDYVQTALTYTEVIGEKCKEYNLSKETRLPYIPLKNLDPTPMDIILAEDLGMPNLMQFFKSKEQADRQLANKMLSFINENENADLDRIESEIKTIWETSEKMNMRWSKYLLQVSDYINIFWEDGDTLVGPARGSGAGFYINYILGISQVDPTREKAPMYPWRFLNPERASLLDIDTDIQGNRRNTCIQALKKQYGEFKVIEVATFGTEKAKSAIRTACRGLNIDVDIATYISSFIDSERGIQHTLKDTFHGDIENGIRPNITFRNLMIDKYPEVWKVAQGIEGLVSRVGKHAGGVVIVDEPFTERAAIMTTNKDEYVSQYELHDLEDLGLIKIDLLAVEALDRIRACLDLLVQYDYIKEESNLRKTYEKTIGIYNLEREDIKMWDMVWKNQIISLFQMEQGSGIQAISLTKPQTLEDLAAINSVMRLMAPERGAEQPLNKYARFKANPREWEQEMLDHCLNKEDRQLIHSYLDYEYGVCATQEDVMAMVQNPRIGGFDLGWSDKLRKAIAKKQPKEFDSLTTEFFENAKEKNLSKELVNYVWNVLFTTQRGYSFNLSHTLSYSLIGLQEMNLAYKFPIIFWNTANIIVDSMATDYIIDEKDIIENINDDEDKEASVVEYGKIAKAIGKMQTYGITVRLPDINKSKFTFSPDVEENSIYYGLKGISKINDTIAENILIARPFTSLSDFLSKVKLNKPQMVSLIKSGAFDKFGDRFKIMKEYIYSISETKKRLTLQNMQMLIQHKLLPKELDLERQVFNFNKYLKKFKKEDDYELDQIAYNFYETHFDLDLLHFNNENHSCINQKDWNKIYKKYMDTARTYIKANEEFLLDKLNFLLVKDVWIHYALGSLSKWEMDSVSFYMHEHELSKVSPSTYELSNFYSLDEDPKLEYSFTTKQGHPVSIFQLFRIAGTVLDKDKTKHTVTILTTSGVVTVKIWTSQFNKYDKQISKLQSNGKKKVLEKSWFSRGNKVIFTGIRRGNNFIPKVYKNSVWKNPIILITDIAENGTIKIKTERDEG